MTLRFPPLIVIALLAACRQTPQPVPDARLAEPPATEAAPPPAEPPPAAILPADLDGDGTTVRVEVYFSADHTRGFLRIRRPAGDWTSPTYRMWKAMAGHLEAGGRDAIVLGVWSDTHRHDEPEPHRAVWVLGGEGGRLSELWRGSALARPLRDFTLGDVDGDGLDELVALDELQGVCRVAAYRWNGFGFAGIARPAVVPCAGLAPCDGPGACVVSGETPGRVVVVGGVLRREPAPP